MASAKVWAVTFYCNITIFFLVGCCFLLIHTTRQTRWRAAAYQQGALRSTILGSKHVHIHTEPPVRHTWSLWENETHTHTPTQSRSKLGAIRFDGFPVVLSNMTPPALWMGWPGPYEPRDERFYSLCPNAVKDNAILNGTSGQHRHRKRVQCVCVWCALLHRR